MQQPPRTRPTGPADVADAVHAGRRLRALTAGVDASFRQLLDTVAAHERDAIDGLSVKVWLEQVCRLLPGDARRVLQVATVLRRFPSLDDAWRAGEVSWSQLGPACTTLGRVPHRHREEVDALLRGALPEVAGAEPGVLLDLVEDIVSEVAERTEAEREERAERRAYLRLQPSLEGGGRLFGEFGPIGFATVVEAVDAAAPQPDVGSNPDGDPWLAQDNGHAVGTARAEGLLRLCGAAHRQTAPGTAPATTASGPAPTTAGSAALPAPTSDGETYDDDEWHDELPDDEGGAAMRRLTRRPLLLATVSLETLLGLSDAPGRLLTTVTGGQVHVTASAARRLANHPAGADLRLVIDDPDGRTVGVGRRTRVPPDWLHHAVLTRHATCTDPSCDRPARTCDLDHLVNVNPDGAAIGGGRTDADNLAPACRSGHGRRTRERRAGTGWQTTTRPDGTLVLRHEQSGIEVVQLSLLALDRIVAAAAESLAEDDQPEASTPCGSRHRS